MAGYVTDVQMMEGGGFGFGISDDRMHTARTWLVYPTQQEAEAARELVLDALASAQEVEITP
jgi:hypothetical protein